jgi:hypothetical protein
LEMNDFISRISGAQTDKELHIFLSELVAAIRIL